LNSVKNIQDKMEAHKICVLIPTYNNDKTLQRVLDGVIAITNNVIVVNDGSTDSTATILEKYTNITLINVKPNKGKGNALRLGFKKARELHYNFAITIDSDGQHYPEEIEVFVSALEQEPDSNVLFIGSRNMDQEGVPKKSSFGHNFSNFWYRVETGIQLTDTQSGYRMYPLEPLQNLRFYTTKFEFEIESIVRAAWKGVRVKNIPIKVLYDPEERVTHFRPFKDFTRISILNTVLVLIAFFYIKPIALFKKANQKGFRKFIKEDVLASHDPPLKKAKSIALGVFIGFSPLWGLHTFLVFFMAVLLRLNKAIAFAFSNVSLPPFIPFIVIASIWLGNLVLGDSVPILPDFNEPENFKMLKGLRTYIVGSFVLATCGALISFIISYFVLMRIQKTKTI